MIPLLLFAMFASPDRFELITVDPGHFHAALIQKEMLPELSEKVHIYAPAGPDLDAHLRRIGQFNSRQENPTRWQTEVHSAPDFWERMLAEQPGNVAVFSGRNRGKIGRIETAARRGLHVLADKPWIIEAEDQAHLASALDAAERSGVAAFDIMTQRYEIANILVRELVKDVGVFGTPLAGTSSEPAVYMESVHHLLKLVAGAPNLRPTWFFDIREEGEGLTDVGTHLVDLVQWTLYPDQALDVSRDVQVLAGTRWPTVLSAAQFERVTGVREFPDALNQWVAADGLRYYCNNSVSYSLRGVHVKLDVKWAYEAPAGGGDTELAIYRGSRARVEARPEGVFVVPNRQEDKSAIGAALGRRLHALESERPGLGMRDRGAELEVTIPAVLRTGHEAHFAMVARKFLGYAKNPASLPAWEKPNMLAKYRVTTMGVALARQSEKKLTARTYNSGFTDAHDTYNGMLAASDGKIYYVLSSEKFDVAGQMYSFDPATRKTRHLADLSEICGEKGRKFIAQGKSHVNFVEAAGKLYFATHVGYYSIIDDMEKAAVPPPGWQPYPGGHLLSYDLATGKFEDLATEPHGEGILTMNLDAARGRVYGLSWPTGHFFRYDLRKKEMKTLGDFFRQGENGKGESYRTICRSLAVNLEDGSVYFTTGEGAIHRYSYEHDSVQTVAGEDMKKDYFGLYDPSSAGHMAYNWRQVVWHPAERMFYGVHGNSGYLFRFDPRAPRVEMVERIASEPSRRSGMFDQFSYGYLGFTLGPDGHTLYYLTGGPIYVDGKRVTGKSSTGKGEAKGEENLHLVTYDIAAGRYTDRGPIFYANGDRPTYVNSIAVGKDGTVYTLARISEGGRVRTDLISIP